MRDLFAAKSAPASLVQIGEINSQTYMRNNLTGGKAGVLRFRYRSL